MLAGLTGCASTLSSMQTAEVTRVKQVEVTGGTGYYIPVGPVVSAVDEGIKQAKAINEAKQSGEPYSLSPEDQQQLLTAAIALAVMPPSQNYQVSLRTGVWDGKMDVGLRYSVNAVRLDTKYQFFHHAVDEDKEPWRRRSFDMAIGVAGAKYIFDNPVIDALDYVQLADFTRWDVEVPLYMSVNVGDVLKLYAVPKYVYSYTSLDASLVNYSEQATNVTGWDLSLPSSVHTHFVGSSAGIMLGYRYVWVVAELTGGYTFCKPVLFGQKRELGGPTFYPSLGLSARFP